MVVAHGLGSFFTADSDSLRRSIGFVPAVTAMRGKVVEVCLRHCLPELFEPCCRQPTKSEATLNHEAFPFVLDAAV